MIVGFSITRPVHYYVFCLFSTLFSFKIHFTDHYCKTAHRAKSRFLSIFIHFGSFRDVLVHFKMFFLCLREVISSLIHDCVYQLVNYHAQTSQLVMLCPRSAVGNVSGYRCVSDCRSRGREFDSGPVPYFRGD